MLVRAHAARMAMVRHACACACHRCGRAASLLLARSQLKAAKNGLKLAKNGQKQVWARCLAALDEIAAVGRYDLSYVMYSELRIASMMVPRMAMLL